VIGSGDWNEDHLMPDIVNALVANEAVVIRNPTAVRPWQHVLEPLWGYMLLGAKLMQEPQRYSSAWNFGSRTQDAIPVESLVQRAISEWGSGDYSVEVDKNAPHEANLLRLDSTRAQRDLGWQPVFDIDTAIRNTLAWYRDYRLEAGDPNTLVRRDIEYFEKSLDNLESVYPDA
jgi:CDP-glucose 4,6-dehydratase